MEKEIYKERLKQINEEFERKRIELYIEYALSNAKFKIGDTIRDERWAFVIDKITVDKTSEFPVPVYRGYELKKDLTPKKNLSRVCICGNHAELVKSADN